MTLPDPTFPPLLSGHDIKGDLSPLEEACKGVKEGRYSAGDVVWSRNTVRLQLVIVLEPEVALEKAVQMIPLAMVACGDCLGVLTPPQVGVTFHWPGTIRVNGGYVGGVTAIVGGRALTAEAVPDWLVLGVNIALKHDPQNPEPGHMPDVTFLDQEGCPDLTRTQLIESYCRHFMAWLNDWNDEGFRPVHDAWLFRTEDRNKEIILDLNGVIHKGIFVGLDENGNLLLKGQDDKVEALMLLDIIEKKVVTQVSPP